MNQRKKTILLEPTTGKSRSGIQLMRYKISLVLKKETVSGESID